MQGQENGDKNSCAIIFDVNLLNWMTFGRFLNVNIRFKTKVLWHACLEWLQTLVWKRLHTSTTGYWPHRFQAAAWWQYLHPTTKNPDNPPQAKILLYHIERIERALLPSTSWYFDLCRLFLDICSSFTQIYFSQTAWCASKDDVVST